MISEAQLDDVMGAALFDQDGDRIGRVGQIYVDDESGRPSWMTVNTGFFGTSESFVPFDRADLAEGGVRVPFTKAFVKGAPHAADDGHLDEAEQDELHRYYAQQGVDDAQQGVDEAPAVHDAAAVRHETAPAQHEVAPAVHEVAPEPTTDRDDTGTTDDEAHRGRHAADVPVDQPPFDQAEPTTTGAGSQSSPPLVGVTVEDGAVIDAPSGRMRLRRYVVTEQRTITVPVTHEEVRLEPIDDAEAPGAPVGAPADPSRIDVREGAHRDRV